MIVLQESGYPLKRVRLSPDGRTLATLGDRSGLRLWDRLSGRSLLLRDHYDSAFAFTPDGAALLTGSLTAIRSTDAVTGREAQVMAIPPGVNVRLLTLDADGRALFALGLGDERRLECWLLRDHQYLFHSEDVLIDIPSATAVSPDGQLLATVTPPDDASLTFAALIDDSPEDDSGPRPADVNVWTTATGRVRHSINAEGPVTALAFSPNSRVLAWVSGTKVYVRDVESWDVLASLHGELKFKSVAFDPTGRLLATTGNDGVVRFWDTETWAERVAFDWGLGAMWDVTFSADGLTAACCGMAGKIVVWDVDV